MYVLKVELDHFEEKSTKMIQTFVSKAQLQILIQNNYSVSELAKQFQIRPVLDPQH
jgi:hypothetical protein